LVSEETIANKLDIAIKGNGVDLLNIVFWLLCPLHSNGASHLDSIRFLSA
jgi:hypothetical protein